MDNEKLQTSSPVPVQDVQPARYLFTDVLREVLNGRKITRVAWGNDEVYGYMDKGILCIEYGDGKHYDWILSEGDIIADDWIVL